MFVSILVLVDAALRHRIVEKIQNHLHVSILVLVDAALRRTARFNAGQQRLRVSILVLVDAALRQ